MTDPHTPSRIDEERGASPRDPAGAAARQRTCGACGGPFDAGSRTDVEIFTDGSVRYVAVHAGHSTFAPAREREIADRLRRIHGAGEPADEAA
ncbi:hypothetical protein ACWED2_07200 [Amycolatopsis sp. NPDC005003]